MENRLRNLTFGKESAITNLRVLAEVRERFTSDREDLVNTNAMKVEAAVAPLVSAALEDFRVCVYA